MSEADRAVGIIMGSQSDWETMQHAASYPRPARHRLRDAHRLGASHARAALRICPHRPRARPAGDHRRRRRSRASPGHDRGADAAAGARRAGREPGAEGRRQPAVDRADAGRGAGRDLRDRPSRRGQRGAVRRGDPRPLRHRRRAGSRRLAASADQGVAERRSGASRAGNAGAGRHDRHPGRRPARPHDGARRRPARLPLPRLHQRAPTARPRRSAARRRSPNSPTAQALDAVRRRRRYRDVRVREHPGRGGAAGSRLDGRCCRAPKSSKSRRTACARRIFCARSMSTPPLTAKFPMRRHCSGRCGTSATPPCSRPCAWAMTARAR